MGDEQLAAEKLALAGGVVDQGVAVPLDPDALLIDGYDLAGRPTTIVDANGATTSLSYSPRGWLETRNVAGEPTIFDYDGVGQLSRVTRPDGSYLQYAYDDAHRLVGVQDDRGNTMVYTLDAIGHRVKEEAYDPGGTRTLLRQRVYDSFGRVHQSVGAQ